MGSVTLQYLRSTYKGLRPDNLSNPTPLRYGVSQYFRSPGVAVDDGVAVPWTEGIGSGSEVWWGWHDRDS